MFEKNPASPDALSLADWLALPIGTKVRRVSNERISEEFIKLDNKVLPHENQKNAFRVNIEKQYNGKICQRLSFLSDMGIIPYVCSNENVWNSYWCEVIPEPEPEIKVVTQSITISRTVVDGVPSELMFEVLEETEVI